jgi:hypothetical protein
VLRAGKVLGKTPYHDKLPGREGKITLMIRLDGHDDRSVVVDADRTIHHVTLQKSRERDKDKSVNPFAPKEDDRRR